MALTATTRRFDFKEFSLEVSVACGDGSELAAIVQSHVLEPAAPHTRGEALVEWVHEQLAHSPIGLNLLGVALQQGKLNRFASARTNGYLL